MFFSILLLALLGVGRGVPVHISVDKIEHNVVIHSENSCFEQVIFWAWSGRSGRYEVMGWLPEESVTPVSGGVLVRGYLIKSKVITHTTTEYDPEMHARRNGFESNKKLPRINLYGQ